MLLYWPDTVQQGARRRVNSNPQGACSFFVRFLYRNLRPNPLYWILSLIQSRQSARHLRRYAPILYKTAAIPHLITGGISHEQLYVGSFRCSPSCRIYDSRRADTQIHFFGLPLMYSSFQILIDFSISHSINDSNLKANYLAQKNTLLLFCSLAG